MGGVRVAGIVKLNEPAVDVVTVKTPAEEYMLYVTAGVVVGGPEKLTIFPLL